MDTEKIVNGSDFGLVVDIPTLNGVPYDARNGEWELDLWVFSNKRVRVKHSIEKGVESIGEVQANAVVEDDDNGVEVIKVFIKASKNPMGKGELKGQMTIYAENWNFEDYIQVIKTFECEIGVRIV